MRSTAVNLWVVCTLCLVRLNRCQPRAAELVLDTVHNLSSSDLVFDFRILDLEANWSSVCKMTQMDFVMFRVHWDNPTRRIESGAWQDAADCSGCKVVGEDEVACRKILKGAVCGANVLYLGVNFPSGSGIPPVSLTSDGVGRECGAEDQEKMARQAGEMLQGHRIFFSHLQQRQDVSAGNPLVLDFAVSEGVGEKLFWGTMIRLLVNETVYRVEGVPKLGTPLVVTLPVGQHQLCVQLFNVFTNISLMRSEPVTVSVVYRSSIQPHSPDDCRSTLLCRTLLEVDDVVRGLGASVTLARYTALGAFLFEWFLPSKPFVPRSLHVPWLHTLYVSLPGHVTASALREAFRSPAALWQAGDEEDGAITITHTTWRVHVHCLLGSKRVPDEEEAGDREGWETIQLGGSDFRLPRGGLVRYLLRERWNDAEHGVMSLPLEVRSVRRAVSEGSAVLWKEYVALAGEAGGARRTVTAGEAGHVLTVLNRWLDGAVLTDGPARNLQLWYAPQCQSFCECSIDNAEDRQQGSATGQDVERWGPRDLSLMCTVEASRLGVRGISSRELGHGVYINHEFKFVYVSVKKAASQSIMKALVTTFGRSFDRLYATKLDRLTPQDCMIEDWLENELKDTFGGKQNAREDSAPSWAEIQPSSCLTREILSDYFFFTFVRAPVPRFHSGLKEAMNFNLVGMLDSNKNFRGTRLTATDLLVGMLDGIVFDSHLEQQVMTVGGAVRIADSLGAGIPWDFIGRMDQNFDRDLAALMEALLRFHAQRGGKGKMPEMDQVLLNVHVNAGGEKKKVVKEKLSQEQDDGLVEGLVRQVYAHDLVCIPDSSQSSGSLFSSTASNAAQSCQQQQQDSNIARFNTESESNRMKSHHKTSDGKTAATPSVQPTPSASDFGLESRVSKLEQRADEDQERLHELQTQVTQLQKALKMER